MMLQHALHALHTLQAIPIAEQAILLSILILLCIPIAALIVWLVSSFGGKPIKGPWPH